MTQFYSRNDVNYSGDVYSIPFDYIDKKEVKVYIDDELWTKWHFLNKHQLTLDEVPENIRYSNIISVRRETDIEEKVVTYDNNSLLNKENLNKSQDQLIYAVQEIYDNNVQFQSDIREEVDEKVERVSDAVEKLEFLEDSVAIANEAALVAFEQAQIATEKAEETLQTYETAMNDFETIRVNNIDEINDIVAGHLDDLNSLDATIKKDADAIINRLGISMFDTVLKDHVLTYEESRGLALQGTYVYKNAVAGERYGYPDFYAKCLEEYNQATTTETVNGVTVKVHSNGHKFYNIADKTGIDEFFNTMGTAWFYGVDTENERIFLPRNNYFDQATGDSSEVGQSVEAGLPNIDGEFRCSYRGSYAPTPAATGVFVKDGTCSIGVKGGNADDWGGVYSFDASRSSSVYKDDVDTVQPNAVKKLLYICVGNTISDTSWVDVVTQVEGGVKDLEDKTNEGISALSNASNALRQTQITNCLLEVPQNIKLELADSTLTLKAGSKVIVPNGVGVFNELTISKDLKIGTIGTATTSSKLYVKADGSGLVQWVNEASGATVPTNNTPFAFYNTADNTCKLYNADGTVQHTASFPIAIIHRTSGSWDKIEQVFNGFGYIGSSYWVTSGIEGLFPWGRNEDGTLNNIQKKTTKVVIKTNASTYTRTNYNFVLDNNNGIGLGGYIEYDGVPTSSIKGATWILNKQDNRVYQWDGSKYKLKTAGLIKLATNINTVNGVITSMTPCQTFRAVDQNEFNNTPHITETYQNGTSWYRVWSDGWCEQGGIVSVSADASGSITLLKPYIDTNYTTSFTIISTTTTTNNQQAGSVWCTSLTTNKINYVNDLWAGSMMWEAKGYIA